MQVALSQRSKKIRRKTTTRHTRHGTAVERRCVRPRVNRINRRRIISYRSVSRNPIERIPAKRPRRRGAARRGEARRDARSKALGFAIHESLITPQTLVNNETKGPPGLIDSDGNSGGWSGEGRNVQFKGKRRTRGGARRLSESLIALSEVPSPRRETRRLA